MAVNAVNLRDFTHDKRQTVDDKPSGGGPGMLMKPEPLFEAVEFLRTKESKVILTGPRGERFSQRIAAELAQESHLIIICGHYEGVDERVREHLADREISIGDYVLTSGNLPAMVMCDAVIRLLPPMRMNRFPLNRVSSNIRNIPGRRSSAAGRSLKFCSPGIMKKLKNGAENRRCWKPSANAPICSKRNLNGGL